MVGFILIWLGAGLAIKDIDTLSKKLKFSSFAVSFLFLGFFTSISEISVGINSLALGNPEIYVGNLIGSSIVIFLLVIPILAILGNGLKTVHTLQKNHLTVILFTIAAPVFLIFDHTISLADATIFILLYAYLFQSMHVERGLRTFLQSFLNFRETAMLRIIGNLAIGIALVLFASHLIVTETIYFAEYLNIAPFIISLLVIAVGTNIPELSIAVRSLYLGKREIALGNYLGSASFNTLLMGALTLLNGGSVILNGNFTLPLLFLVAGLWLFYYYGKSGHRITRTEGTVLLVIYIAFVLSEAVKAGLFS